MGVVDNVSVAVCDDDPVMETDGVRDKVDVNVRVAESVKVADDEDDIVNVDVGDVEVVEVNKRVRVLDMVSVAVVEGVTVKVFGRRANVDETVAECTRVPDSVMVVRGVAEMGTV